jgi:hypothetical protein
MKQLLPLLRTNRLVAASVVLALVGFGVSYQLWSRADDGAGAEIKVVDGREEIRSVIKAACERAGKSVVGEINDLKVENEFAQATAVCRSASDASVQPTYFTLKFAGNIWQMLQQGFEPPSPANLPDPQLPAQFAHGE